MKKFMKKVAESASSLAKAWSAKSMWVVVVNGRETYFDDEEKFENHLHWLDMTGTDYECECVLSNLDPHEKIAQQQRIEAIRARKEQELQATKSKLGIAAERIYHTPHICAELSQ